jgi:hypothetical protein
MASQSTCAQPIFRHLPRWRTALTPSGLASCSTTGSRISARIEIDISHSALAGGQLCDDGQWRQIVTIEDALAGGCTLFDLDLLKRENSDEDFKNLFMCEFVDDKASVFPFEELQRCMVDVMEEWEDFAPFADHPFGSRPVWIGYDPSHTGDSAGCVVLAPPVVSVASSACWSATSGKAWTLQRRQRASAS